MKTFYFLLLALSISAVSCKTKEGEPGPAGESALNKQGSISGTITYTNDDGNTATAPFNYQYYESLEDNYFTYNESGTDAYYELQIQRRDSKDDNNYFDFQIEGDATNGVENDPYYVSTEFSFITLVNNDIYAFFDNDIEITNLSLDPTTGRVTFSFTGTVYDINENSATITGTADITLSRLRQNNIEVVAVQ